MSDLALEGLDERQLEAVTTLRGPVCVLAGAGTGKTRVITHRIAHGVDTGAYSPGRVMAVTFTAKAAGEMRGRLRALGVGGVSARTFHSAALAQLNFFWPTLAGDVAPKIVDNKVRLLAHAADGIKMNLDTATLRDVASQIEWRKVTMRTIEQYASLERTVGRLAPSAVAELQTAYEKLKDERRQLDFEDVLLACAGMLEAEPRVAHAVHEQYRHFTVDEYQDVSPLQHRLLELWVGNRPDLCVVGDASQTIYSFAGADSRYLLDFEASHEGAHMVRLETNYRSDAAVLAVANELMRGRPGALELVATHGEAVSPEPSVTAYDTDQEEAEGVARAIEKQLSSGISPEQIAILYRSHGQSPALQQALAARGVSATVLGGRRFFDMPEVRQAIMALRGASVAPIETSFLAAVRDVLRSLGLADEPPAAGGALRDAWEARSALLRLAEHAEPGTDLRTFTDALSARARDQHEPALRTVTLSTLHAAKGLEWDHVHMVGVAEGLLPISYANTFEGYDEERRLAYVGITRAARTLGMSWSGGQGRSSRTASRFLGEIGTRSLRVVGAKPIAGVRSSRGSSPTADADRDRRRPRA